MLFDEPYYLAINEARWQAANTILDELQALSLSTCLDVGAGPGWFSARLAKKGLHVIGVEGRESVIEVARQRAPMVDFVRADVERMGESPRFEGSDLVFCFGLLYHLENPFAFLRTLRGLTRKLLLLETQIIPGDEPFALLVEEGRNETQGLTHAALIPTKPCLFKMLSLAGFRYLYEWLGAVHHQDFMDTPERHRRRGIFAASDFELAAKDLDLVPIPSTPKFNFCKMDR